MYDQTYAWNDPKRRFLPRQIAVAFDVLRSKGWLAAAEFESSDRRTFKLLAVAAGLEFSVPRVKGS
jgi:hypothetical protein